MRKVSIMEINNNGKRYRKVDRGVLFAHGYTEEEMDALEWALNNDRNISRFTDPEIVSDKDKKNDK